MPVRQRKLIGMAAISIGLAAYTLAAVYVAVELLPENRLLEFSYYCIAGTVWALPARGLLVWMHRPNAVQTRQRTTRKDL